MNSLTKKPQKSSRKKVILFTALTLILLVAGAGAYTYKMKLWPFSSHTAQTTKSPIDYNPPTKEQSTATGSTKQQSDPSETTGSDASPNPSPSTTPGQKPTVNMTITAANESDGTLYIRTLIETISSNGTCTLSMTGPNGKTYSSTAGVQANPSTSTCQGFNVPVNSLVSGAWHITINYADSSVQASASKDIIVQ